LWTVISAAFQARALRADRERYEYRLRLASSQSTVRNRVPKVSILVAAWNEVETLERCIQSISRLRYPNIELIICAGGSEGSYEIARDFAGPGVIVLEQLPGEGKQGALRRCLASSTGDIIFLTDADCELNDSAFEATLKPLLDDGEHSATTGAYQPLPEQRADPFVVYQWAIQLFDRSRMATYSDGLLGGGCAIRRDALEQAGAFQAQASTGTDYVLARQLIQKGTLIRSIPATAVDTRFETRLRDYSRQRARWLRNLLVHGWSYRSGGDVRHALLTGLIGAAGLGLPVGALVFGRTTWVLWSALVVHSLLARARYLYLAHGLGIRVPASTLARLPLYLAADWLLAVRAILEALWPHRRWAW
jgi:cellulose synthase/poly-beta-1,6-N-acetylglucosamine synthase-like glycosyltransferase